MALDYSWTYEGHIIKAIRGDNRFGTIPIYIDGKPYGHASISRGLIPRLEYDISLGDKTLKLVVVNGGMDLFDNGKSLTNGTFFDFSPVSIPIRVLLYLLLLAPSILAFALGAHIAVKIATVWLALCGGFLITVFFNRPATTHKKKILLCIGIVFVCIVICSMMWVSLMLIQH